MDRPFVGQLSLAVKMVVAQTLQRLEVPHSVVPPQVEYSLTPLGGELAPKVGELADWIDAQPWARAGGSPVLDADDANDFDR